MGMFWNNEPKSYITTPPNSNQSRLAFNQTFATNPQTGYSSKRSQSQFGKPWEKNFWFWWKGAFNQKTFKGLPSQAKTLQSKLELPLTSPNPWQKAISHGELCQLLTEQECYETPNKTQTGGDAWIDFLEKWIKSLMNQVFKPFQPSAFFSLCMITHEFRRYNKLINYPLAYAFSKQVVQKLVLKNTLRSAVGQCRKDFGGLRKLFSTKKETFSVCWSGCVTALMYTPTCFWKSKYEVDKVQYHNTYTSFSSAIMIKLDFSFLELWRVFFWPKLN